MPTEPRETTRLAINSEERAPPFSNTLLARHNPHAMQTSSTIAPTLARLKYAGAEFASLDWGYPVGTPRFDAPIAAAELAELDAQVVNALPNDLVEFYKLCGGITAMDIHNGYAVLPLEQAVQIRRDGPTHVIADGTRHAFIPVAADGGGNLFLLQLASPFCVWRSNHERVTGPEVDESAVRQVAVGFSEFLARVAEDWEHFVDGDQDWNFLI
jgi:hypothetical protein